MERSHGWKAVISVTPGPEDSGPGGGSPFVRPFGEGGFAAGS